MKNLLKLAAFLAALLQLTNCTNHLESGYTVVLPAVPEAWISILGQPHWRVQWLDSAGQIQKKDIIPGESATVIIPATWVNPVTAWPWWPQIIPGLFKPAGGLFPFDVSGGNINLSWEAGADTVYYWELAWYASQALANGGNETRIPANFDWLRFRELFTTGVLSEEVCKDPWLVNWQSVAESTIASGFDRRRIKPEDTEFIAIPVEAGYWYGASPFTEPLVFAEGETSLFPVCSGVNVWVSSEGILRVSGNTWIFTELRK